MQIKRAALMFSAALALLLTRPAHGENPTVAVRVPLEKGWRELPQEGHVRSFQRDGGVGALQVTGYAHASDDMPTKGKDLRADLLFFVHGSGLDSVHAPVVTSGACAVGRYAKAAVRGPENKGEIVWMASDGTRMVLVTYGYDQLVSSAELAQVDTIIMRLAFAK